jgi:drug/metabolite transporter (DMT)-like permease
MRAVGFALVAGLLFGLSTPAAKVLLTATAPWMLAGLLYLGSGIGLGGFQLVRAGIGHASREAPLRRADGPWLTAAVVAGGLVGPVLLMFGLAAVAASEASLLLNLETVLTATLAWFVFREHVHARIAAGMLLITVGALVLGWSGAGLRLDSGALLVAGACLAWAVDNNLTRRVSGGDPVLIAALKGTAAGSVNLAIARATGAEFPAMSAAVGILLVGLLGYGLSLALFGPSVTWARQGPAPTSPSRRSWARWPPWPRSASRSPSSSARAARSCWRGCGSMSRSTMSTSTCTSRSSMTTFIDTTSTISTLTIRGSRRPSRTRTPTSTHRSGTVIRTIRTCTTDTDTDGKAVRSDRGSRVGVMPGSPRRASPGPC